MNDIEKKEILKKTVIFVDRSGISSIKQTVSGILKIIDDPDATAKDM